MNQHDDLDPIAHLREWGRETERRVRRQRRLRGSARWLRWLLMAATAVALIAAVAPAVRSVWPHETAAPAPSVDGITATSSASAAPTDPFEGTAAARYPVGTDGITLPKAQAVSGFTVAQVEAALDRVHDALVAGRLDADMTVRHRTDGFVGLLAPNARPQLKKWFTDGTFDSVATWIDPAVKLDPRNPARVSGRVTYKSVVEKGVRTLRVTTNFVWVYAFQGEFANRPLAIKHDQIDWRFPRPADLRAADQGMWIGDVKSYGAWLDCAAAEKGLLAPTPKNEVGGRPGDEDQESLAKPDHPLEITGNCP